MSRQFVDPTLAPMLDLLPGFAVDDASLGDSRALFAALELAPMPAGVARSELLLRTGNGEPPLRGLLYEPVDQPVRGSILHLHGGGFIMGRAEMCDGRNGALTAALGYRILSVEYRLAPEHIRPTGYGSRAPR